MMTYREIHIVIKKKKKKEVYLENKITILSIYLCRYVISNNEIK